MNKKSVCGVRVGGHNWDDPHDNDEKPTSYCLACGMRGQDYTALKEAEAHIEALESLFDAVGKCPGPAILALGNEVNAAWQKCAALTAKEKP